jgi:NAD(P)H-hydrate epimerase
MARLLGASTDSIQLDRVGAARRLASATGACVALKGARTVVATPDGRAFINPTGNPGLASAGTGDVLTGLVGAMLAQGLDPLDALLVGVFVHGRAADQVVARRATSRGLIARDVIARLPQALALPRAAR